MKITQLEILPLTGATVDGGWPQDLEAEENLHTLIRLTTDDGLSVQHVARTEPS